MSDKRWWLSKMFSSPFWNPGGTPDNEEDISERRGRREATPFERKSDEESDDENDPSSSSISKYSSCEKDSDEEKILREIRHLGDLEFSFSDKIFETEEGTSTIPRQNGERVDEVAIFLARPEDVVISGNPLGEISSGLPAEGNEPNEIPEGNSNFTDGEWSSVECSDSNSKNSDFRVKNGENSEFTASNPESASIAYTGSAITQHPEEYMEKATRDISDKIIAIGPTDNFSKNSKSTRSTLEDTEETAIPYENWTPTMGEKSTARIGDDGETTLTNSVDLAASMEENGPFVLGEESKLSDDDYHPDNISESLCDYNTEGDSFYCNVPEEDTFSELSTTKTITDALRSIHSEYNSDCSRHQRGGMRKLFRRQSFKKYKRGKGGGRLRGVDKAWKAFRGWTERKLNETRSASSSEEDGYSTMKSRRSSIFESFTLRRQRVSKRIKNRRSSHPQGQDGFEELRRYIKQGGDFCKELSVILQERSEAELQYAKTLSKLSSKLLKVSKDAVGSVSQAWHKAGIELENTSDVHKTFAAALCEEVVKPLKQLLESQHRIRKSVEAAVDKTGKKKIYCAIVSSIATNGLSITGKSLNEWRSMESKSKKQSFVSARENEKLQDVMLDLRLSGGSLPGKLTASNVNLHRQSSTSSSAASTEKECAKLEAKRKKSEELVKKSDVEYYTYCIRAERARLEWETAVVRGGQCFQALEEERLQKLKHLAFTYWQYCKEIGPKLIQNAMRMKDPIDRSNVDADIKTIAAVKGVRHPVTDQYLPDFYAEHTTLAMNRERRKRALVKILQMIVQDMERERRGKHGVENLAKACQETPNFGTLNSHQNITEKLHHMRYMLTYLEAARYKVSKVLAELDGKPTSSHPLAPHIQVIRDRQGFQQSILKVPSWIQKDSSTRLESTESPDWADRGSADGNSVQPESDFDEFSSQSSNSDRDFESASVSRFSVTAESSASAAASTSVPATDISVVAISDTVIGKCKALYQYSANLYDELNLQPGDIINIREKQPDGWWLGDLKGVIGIFPATYVEEII